MLRLRAVVISLLPLVLTIAVAIPEARLQREALGDATKTERASLAASNARDITDARVDASLAIRRMLQHVPQNPEAYAQASRAMNADAASLSHLTAGTPSAGAARNVEASVSGFGGVLDRIARAFRAGRIHEANAVHVGKAYNESIERVQQSVKTFVLSAHSQRSGANKTLQRLWTTSSWLLLIAIIGMLGASVLAVLHASSLVNAIRQLVAKTERRRRGEPLGKSSPRRDELGTLDSALYDLVAEQHRREQLLDRYRLLSEVTEDIILFVDRSDLTTVDANAAALKAYQYDLAELVGKPASMLAANGRSLPAEVMARSDTPEGLSHEMMHRRADGSVFPVEMHARTADIEGRPTIIVTARDISERREAAVQVAKALDQAVEGSRLKSEFVATMSHEIRTPMHGVIGMSELLLQTPLTVQQQEYAATVKESAQALLAIINDILDFSRLEAHKLELETVAFDPQQVVAAVISLARGTARDKGLTLRSVASQHVPGAVRGDPKRLRQVLMNLVGNAVKFTPNGAVSVSISVERETAEAVVLAFAVSDTGIGIAPEARNRVFEAFVQGDGTTTRDFGGTGLGLSISRRLVELMGGRLWLGDHDGPGSTFCFTARFERTSEAVVPVPLGATALRVLVVDDDPTIRRTLEATLSSWGMHGASSGDINGARAQLLDAARAGTPFDILLIDYVLPGGDGIAFASEVGTHPEYGEPGRILITAFDASGRREAALAAGCSAYLLKPIELSNLYNTLTAISLKRKDHEPARSRTSPRARVLLAEDSALIRRVGRSQLEQLDIDIDIVENGEQAVKAEASGDYELVLMDLRMPVMDGLAATRAIRAKERENGRHVVVVALTANVLDSDREACTEAGMDDFLAKPMQLDALRNVLERWLPGRI